MLRNEIDLERVYVPWREIALFPPLFGVEARFGEHSRWWSLRKEFPSKLQVQLSGATEVAASRTLLAALALCKNARIDGRTHMVTSDKEDRIQERKRHGLKPTEQLNAQEKGILEAGRQLGTEISKFWLSSAEPLVESGAAVRVVARIVNKLGIHASPAARFCSVACKFKSHIFASKDGEVVDGKDMMALMMLAAGPGSVLHIFAVGGDARQATAALDEVVRRKFDED
jgi:phosphocarrier protein HPr